MKTKSPTGNRVKKGGEGNSLRKRGGWTGLLRLNEGRRGVGLRGGEGLGCIPTFEGEGTKKNRRDSVHGSNGKRRGEYVFLISQKMY